MKKYSLIICLFFAFTLGFSQSDNFKKPNHIEITKPQKDSLQQTEAGANINKQQTLNSISSPNSNNNQTTRPTHIIRSTKNDTENNAEQSSKTNISDTNTKNNNDKRDKRPNKLEKKEIQK